MSMFLRFLLVLLFPLVLSAADPELKAEISFLQGQTVSSKQNKFQPVFPMQISVLVKNTGAEASKLQKVCVRYAFPRPHHIAPQSNIFQTEPVDLPALKPGEGKAIQFAKTQTLPTIDDFVRQDYAMREYQAIVVDPQGHEEIIGTVNLTYSAYYYPINHRK